MRVAGWIFVMMGFALGFVLGFGVPMAEALPGLAPAGGAGGVGGWLLARPPWVAPMLLGVALLTVSGWIYRDPDRA